MNNHPADRPPGPHGTPRRWLSGCRCDACTGYIDDLRSAVRRNLEPYGRLPVDLDIVGAEHGTRRGQRVFGCGCALCQARKPPDS